MQPHSSLLAALFLAAPAVADCILDGRTCRWVGSAPFCGQHTDRSGFVCIDHPEPAYEWDCQLSTEDEGIDEKRERLGDAFEDCYQDYGMYCRISGYKQLYCRKE